MFRAIPTETEILIGQLQSAGFTFTAQNKRCKNQTSPSTWQFSLIGKTHRLKTFASGSSPDLPQRYGEVAQLVEHRIEDPTAGVRFPPSPLVSFSLVSDIMVKQKNLGDIDTVRIWGMVYIGV